MATNKPTNKPLRAPGRPAAVRRPREAGDALDGDTFESETHGIRVRVTPSFDNERSNPSESEFFWLYTVEIANASAATVQLISRHWRITDGRGQLHEVKGPGVVGEQPVLAPGQSYSYTSGCPLRTPTGFMVGTYQMVAGDGDPLTVAIPAFSLDSPFQRRSLN